MNKTQLFRTRLYTANFEGVFALNSINLVISLLLSLAFAMSSYAQLRFLPLEHYYRDRAFGVSIEIDSNQTAFSQPQSFGSFFPALESQTYRVSQLNKTKNRTTWFGRKLFDEHFFEYENEEFFITFDILADLSLGRDFRDPEDKDYFFNTRGVHVNGGIGKYFGFFSNIRENQARFLDYQVREIRKGGAISFNTNNGNYGQGGGFVSGGNTTKGFKVDAFDFAYVTGGLIFKPSKRVFLTLGNNPIFIGAGHRSLLYSDHSNMFTHLRFSLEINKYFNAQIVYAQHLNIIRMTLNTPGTDRLSEKKGYTLKYLNFVPHRSIQVSLFEGTNWLRADNNNIGRVDALFFNPMPFINPAIQGQKAMRSNTLLGAQAVWNPIKSVHIYSQFAFDDIQNSEPSMQFGMRFSEPFHVRDLHFLIEANRIPENAYQHENPRLNYVNNNMPLAHPMGAGIDEIVGRINYEWRRIGIALQANAIRTVKNIQNGQNGIPLAPRPIPNNAVFREAIVGFGQLDLLYRFNRRSNLQIFSTLIYRQERFSSNIHETFYIGFGMRTPLSNRYFDL